VTFPLPKYAISTKSLFFQMIYHKFANGMYSHLFFLFFLRKNSHKSFFDMSDFFLINVKLKLKLLCRLKFDKFTIYHQTEIMLLNVDAVAVLSISIHGWIHRYRSWHRSCRSIMKNRISINNILESKFLVENILIHDNFIKSLNNSYKGYAAILS